MCRQNVAVDSDKAAQKSLVFNALAQARDERDQNFDAMVRIRHDKNDKHCVSIDTRVSRDSRLNNNGGDYDYWLRVFVNDDGTTLLARTFCSCDFWQPDKEPQVIGNANHLEDLIQEIEDKANKMRIPAVIL